MLQSKSSSDRVVHLNAPRSLRTDDIPRRTIDGATFILEFEQLSHLYCELASRVTETDVLRCMAQGIPQIMPCDRLSYAVPHPDGRQLHVVVFDSTMAKPLELSVASETSGLTEVVTHQQIVIQQTDSTLYAEKVQGAWVSCHIPVFIDGNLGGILNIASDHHLEEVQTRLPLFCSMAKFLSQTFTRIQHQAQGVCRLNAQAMCETNISSQWRSQKPEQTSATPFTQDELQPFALLFVNLDEFRIVPEEQPRILSPETKLKWGDRLQEQVTEALNAQLRGQDLIARVGSTEFLIALKSDSFSHIPQVASRLVNIFKHPIMLDDQEIQISCSIGISFYPEDGQTTDELIKKADLAMHESKEQGTGPIALSRSKLSHAMGRRLQIEQGLSHPHLNHHLSIVYQPQWDCRNEQLYGFECLVRWHHPELGFISPAEFIPIAEELGCIQTITHLALAQALKLTRRILDTFSIIVRPSVNVSASELATMPALYEMTHQLLHEHQLPGNILTIELTERVFLQQSETIMAYLNQFQERGIRISLDDFGTGFSALNYLLDLPLNLLKIDRTFVHNLHQDPKRRGIVQAILAMANSLGMQFIAEGVETHAELDCLQELGCELIQGHMIAPALSADGFIDFIRTSQSQSWRHPA